METDFAPLYAELEGQQDFDPAAVLPTDRVFTRGSQAYARSRAGAGA